MNRPGNRPGEHVTISEITDLIAWARRLSTAAPGATSPAERAAFHAAKADLFARIEDQHTPHTAAINTAAINTGLPDPRPNHPRRDIR